MFKMLGAAVAAVVLSCAGAAGAAVVINPSPWGPYFSCVKACADGTEVDFTPASWHSPGWVIGTMRSLTFDVFEISNATPFTNVRFKGGLWGTPESRSEEVIGTTDANGYFRIEGLAFKGNALLTVGYRPYDVYIDASGVSLGVPEPSTWAMLVVGFTGVGGALRRAQRVRRREGGELIRL